MKTIYILGHKSHHTHGYIHSSYYKAFKSLGYNTVWENDISRFDIKSGDVIFTEGQVDSNIPLRNDLFYILHHCDLRKYIEHGCKYVQLGNYLGFCNIGKNHYYPGDPMTRVTDYIFHDVKNKLIYQPWATDLTPDEIDLNTGIEKNQDTDEVAYVGSIYFDNNPQINDVARSIFSDGKRFVNYTNVTDDQNKDIIRKTYLTFDTRGLWHMECGYIPCRSFKNISYGRMCGTNSEAVYNFFNKKIPFAHSTELYAATKIFDNSPIHELKDYVKEHHTFLNRVKSLFNFIDEVYGI